MLSNLLETFKLSVNFESNEKGERKAGRSGITLNVEEFDELVKLIPKVQENIAKYEVRDTGIPQSPFKLDLPVIDLDIFLPSPPSQEPGLDLPKFPSPPTTVPDLSTPTLTDSTLRELSNALKDNETKSKERRAKGSTKTNGKGERKTDVKRECIDEVASVEAMVDVEKKLWLEHYNQLCEKLMEVVREKCTGCQSNEANQLGHELCLLATVEEQVSACFEYAYIRVNWDKVMERWYNKVLELPVALNPETLANFRETINPEELTYKNRLRKWLIESPTIEV